MPVRRGIIFPLWGKTSSREKFRKLYHTPTVVDLLWKVCNFVELVVWWGFAFPSAFRKEEVKTCSKYAGQPVPEMKKHPTNLFRVQFGKNCGKILARSLWFIALVCIFSRFRFCRPLFPVYVVGCAWCAVTKRKLPETAVSNFCRTRPYALQHLFYCVFNRLAGNMVSSVNSDLVPGLRKGKRRYCCVTAALPTGRKPHSVRVN